jgi:integrase
MEASKLPIGIRKTPPLKDGSFMYVARINRKGIKMSKNCSTIKEAVAWKARTDALIESGIDPRELEENNLRKRITKADSHTTAPSIPMAEIRDVAPPAQVDMTVEQAIDDYLAHRSSTSHAKLKSNQITEYERVRDDLGNLKIANLVNKDIVNYISYLLTAPRKRDDPTLAKVQKAASAPKSSLSAKALANERYKARVKAQKPPREPKPLAEATVRKYILAMKTAIKWQAKNNGVDYHKFLFEFDSKTMPAAWNGRRDRRLLSGEEERLYSAGIDRGGYTYTEEDWRMLLGFALETALRQQELAFARWDDQRNDWSKLFIPKKNSKTKKDRYILLSPRAREIIENQKSNCPKGAKRIFYQFPNPKAMCDSYMKLTARAGIDNLTFHDLRHEATSRLCESGKMSLMEIMEMTGHDTMATFKGYVKLIAHENSRRLS